MDPIFLDGVNLMIVGMLMVFFFLIIMVVMVNLNAKLLAPFKNAFEPKATPAKAASKPVKKDLTQDKQLVAVLSEAIKTYKKDK